MAAATAKTYLADRSIASIITSNLYNKAATVVEISERKKNIEKIVKNAIGNNLIL